MKTLSANSRERIQYRDAKGEAKLITIKELESIISVQREIPFKFTESVETDSRHTLETIKKESLLFEFNAIHTCSLISPKMVADRKQTPLDAFEVENTTTCGLGLRVIKPIPMGTLLFFAGGVAGSLNSFDRQGQLYAMHYLSGLGINPYRRGGLWALMNCAPYYPENHVEFHKQDMKQQPGGKELIAQLEAKKVDIDAFIRDLVKKTRKELDASDPADLVFKRKEDRQNLLMANVIGVLVMDRSVAVPAFVNVCDLNLGDRLTLDYLDQSWRTFPQYFNRLTHQPFPPSVYEDKREYPDLELTEVIKMGRRFFALQDYDQAEFHFRKALEVDLTAVCCNRAMKRECYSQLVVCYRQLKMSDQERACLQKIKRIDACYDSLKAYSLFAASALVVAAGAVVSYQIASYNSR